MHHTKSIGLMMCCALLMAASVFAQDLTRFEAEVFGTEGTGGVADIDDVAGYNYYLRGGSFSDLGKWVDAEDASASGGWLIRTGYTWVPLKVIFYGTGLNLIVQAVTADGGDLDWVLDKGLSGSQSGTISTNDSDEYQVSIPIVSGLEQTLHTVEFQAYKEIDGVAADPAVVRIDAFDVIGALERARVDFEVDGEAGKEGNPAFTFNTTEGPGWIFGEATFDANKLSNEGSYCYTVQSDFGGAATPDSVVVPFSGESIVVGIVLREIDMAFDWDIDGAYSGFVDCPVDHIYGWGITYRWPYLLKNDLGVGNHTLTITAKDATGQWSNYKKTSTHEWIEPTNLYLPLDYVEIPYAQPINAVRDGYWAFY
jgi:hypothetical protein